MNTLLTIAYRATIIFGALVQLVFLYGLWETFSARAWLPFLGILAGSTAFGLTLQYVLITPLYIAMVRSWPVDANGQPV